MRGLLLLPLVVAFAQGDTLFFRPHENQVSGVACPDKKTYCPDGNTCCARETGEFACCPLSSKASLISGNVMCPDGQHECKDGQTCCKLESGEWGCCPLPKAVCCSDGKHCCPENTKCEVSSGKCMRGDSLIMDWFEKTPALRSRNVVCPDGQSECKTGQTCCKLSSGQYGCCPLPKAVCCSDGKHCCPENTKCEVSSGKCMRGDRIVLNWFDKVPAMRRLPAATSVKKDNSVQCPDQKTSCPDKNTCCKNKEGNFGCCAYDNAVCCKSGTYCCPKGYICDTLPEICRMPEAKEAWKNTANRFIQRILRKKVAGQP